METKLYCLEFEIFLTVANYTWAFVRNFIFEKDHKLWKVNIFLFFRKWSRFAHI